MTFLASPFQVKHWAMGKVLRVLKLKNKTETGGAQKKVDHFSE